MNSRADNIISSAMSEMAAPYELAWPGLLEKHGICKETLKVFSEEIHAFYLNQGRKFSWRSEISPYRVLVSEIMLQQTQTGRVEEKFAAFLGRFPGFQELAAAEFSEVLRYWKGLGYNRRAKYLHDISRIVVVEFDSVLPDDPEILVRFKGIGKATAASICVFAFNKPYVFIETNIRTVFIHFFFPDQLGVSDAEIVTLVEKTLDRENPRLWFYALMDYGVMLKQTVGNLSRRSSTYRKQSRFEGSDRQLRGRILDLLLNRTRVDVTTAARLLEQPEDRLRELIGALCAEGLVVEDKGWFRLS
ncbi:MAG: A/G-specific adenine glycosylase [Desulfocapsaceae bacterium]